MKYIFLLLTVFTLFIFPASASARPDGVEDDPKQNIGPCKEESYCDPKDGKTLIRKYGCRIAYQYEDICKQDDARCREKGDWCVCATQRLENSCGNLGGVQDARNNSVDSVFGRITAPAEIRSLGDGEGAINNIIQRVIQLIYIAAGIAFVFMFIWSAFQMITSGGGKEGLAAAKQRITWSIIGIALLALAFPILRILESVLGFKFFG